MPQPDAQFNRAYLDDMSGGDAEFILEILSTFLETAHDLLAGIEEAARKQNAEQAVFYAHTLKGSARSIGAEKLGSVCEELEKCGRAGDMARFQTLAPSVPLNFSLLEQELKAMFQLKAA